MSHLVLAAGLSVAAVGSAFAVPRESAFVSPAPAAAPAVDVTAFGTESSGSSSTAEHLALVDESWHGTGESELAADNTYHADSITHSESMQPLVLAGGKVAGLKAVSFPARRAPPAPVSPP